jgi:hypothetical protein
MRCSVLRAVVALGDADAHERRTCAFHDGLDVVEVGVDLARRRDDVGDALDCLAKDLIGHGEGGLGGGLRFDDGEELVVRDDDVGIHFLLEVGETALGDVLALRAFEGERTGDDGDGERADLFGDLRDDRSGAGAGAAAHAAGDEHHVRTLERFLDLLARLFGGAAAEFRIHAGAETA